MATDLRDEVRGLVDALSDEDLATAAKVLKGLLALDEVESASYTFEDAPEVDPEPDEIEELEAARAREARCEDEYVSHEEARRILLGEDA